MTDNVDMRGKVAIVTGGASGIGLATAEAFAQKGASVVVVDLKDDVVRSAVEKVQAVSADGPSHAGFAVDVRREEQLESMVEEVVDRYGQIDVLVCCAAVLRGAGSSPKPLHRIATDEWDQVLDTNLKGTFLTNRAVLDTMMRQRSGDIVNLSSVSGRHGRAHDAPYCASKFGVIGMSESLAEEVQGFGVRVQIVAPDAVKTPIWEQNGPVPCPPEALEPERVAELIALMVTLPRDTILLGATIAPLKVRKRTKKKPEAREEGVAT